MNIDFDTLTELKSANSRVNYDLRYSGKTEKFTVSSAAFSRLNLNSHGFKVFQDANGNVVMQVVPNSEATIFAGKTSSETKSNAFSASDLADMIGVTDDAEWNMVEVKHNDDTYYILDLLRGSIEDVENTQAPEEVETQETESITQL